jgi:hypothetical protein
MMRSVNLWQHCDLHGAREWQKLSVHFRHLSLSSNARRRVLDSRSGCRSGLKRLIRRFFSTKCTFKGSPTSGAWQAFRIILSPLLSLHYYPPSRLHIVCLQWHKG